MYFLMVRLSIKFILNGQCSNSEIKNEPWLGVIDIDAIWVPFEVLHVAHIFFIL